MDRSDVIKLVKRTRTQDANGVVKSAETSRTVYCSIKSVSHSEKAENGLLGLTPTYLVSMFRFDYEGEEIVEYNGKRYVIYDSTEWNDLVRLYMQKEKGI